jgi:hypothetical protein
MIRRALAKSRSSVSTEPDEHAPSRKQGRRYKRRNVDPDAVFRILLMMLLATTLGIIYLTWRGYQQRIMHPDLNRIEELHPIVNHFPPAYPRRHQDQNQKIQLSSQALEMCTQTLWHTLETTTIVLPDGDTFIHTGDIDDLWLRDSAAQIHPLYKFLDQDPRLDRVVAGLIQRTSRYIRHDPYANAFRIDDSYVFSDEQKKMGRHDLISTW